MTNSSQHRRAHQAAQTSHDFVPHNNAPTVALCEWGCELQWSEVPEEVREHTAWRVLDTLGLVIAGAPSAAGRAAITAATALSARSDADTIPLLSPDQVALLLGTLAHCRDFDDTLPDSLAHPGSVVVPAALAAAHLAQSTDEDFATGIVVGYEVAARLSQLAGTSMLSRGFHSTGAIGSVAAAAAAARVLRLTPLGMMSAIGLSCSMAGGLMAFLADGSWSKWLHAGWSAHGGVHAALLARAGFLGPTSALFGKDGLAQVFMGIELQGEPVAFAESLGTRWCQAQATTKIYPCAHVIQPYIDAAIALKREHQLDATQVESVTCELPGWAVDVVALPRDRKLNVRTEMDAISSLAYMVSCGFLDEQVSLRSLSEEQRGREDIRAFASKVSHETADGLGRSLCGPVIVRMRSGEVYRRVGVLERPGREEICAKFLANVAFGVGAHQVNPSSRAFIKQLLGAHAPEWKASRSFLASRLSIGKLLSR